MLGAGTAWLGSCSRPLGMELPFCAAGCDLSPQEEHVSSYNPIGHEWLKRFLG